MPELSDLILNACNAKKKQHMTLTVKQSHELVYSLHMLLDIYCEAERCERGSPLEMHDVLAG